MEHLFHAEDWAALFAIVPFISYIKAWWRSRGTDRDPE